MVIKRLERYFNINKNEATAKFQIAKNIQSNISSTVKGHDSLKKEFNKSLNLPEFNPAKSIGQLNGIDYLKSGHLKPTTFLDLKIKLLIEVLKECNFCERQCEVNRYEKRGFCKCGVESYYSSEFLHFGEEPELVPSHTIFFNRCTFSCVFCQNYDIVYRDELPVKEGELAKIIDLRHSTGSKNVNFVGGNPDQHSHNILKILKHVKSNIPVVWNSNMYHSSKLANIIEDVVDLWLADFKYGNNKCAKRYSNAKKYWEVVTRNLLRAKNNGDILIRHLVMPGHIECCTEPLVKWISKNLGANIRFNLMFQYRPEFKAFKYPEIDRELSEEEKKMAINVTHSYLENVV